ncbi:DUF4123 domain-containing protein [Pseudomonas sp. DWP3-1-2]|uniref:DUF4123 domain-containing protein n=1 Tax=Pseudomonas sp. DWP3-1-2 TaxID=2804645 RepID=UPI003CF340E3
MSMYVKDWLNHLHARAMGKGLGHVDVLINATGLEYPLLPELRALQPAPLIALLFEGTPEHALAQQGPVLVRLTRLEADHFEWLDQFLSRLHREARVISPLSDWPFEALAKHLRWCSQAQWDRGASHGLFCYYDARLFQGSVQALAAPYSTRFHAAAFSWCWLDRSGTSRELAGRHCRHTEAPDSPSALVLNEEQVTWLRARGAAERWCCDHDIKPYQYGLNRHEDLIQHVFHGQLAASRERGKLNDAQRDEFIRQWLAQNSPCYPGQPSPERKS